MSKRDDLLAVADRCEREEGSGALNEAIERAIHNGGPFPVTTVAYTTSLDAAVALVPQPGSWEVSASGCATVTVLCGRFLVSDDIERHATGRTPAAALTAAALRARAALSPTDGAEPNPPKVRTPIMTNPRRQWTPEATATLKRMSDMGFDDAKIAERLGFCVKTIRRKRHEMQIPNYFVVRYSSWGTLTADARRAISMVASVA